MSLAEFWKKYDIKHTNENLQASWQEVTASDTRALQQNLTPHSANNFAGPGQT